MHRMPRALLYCVAAVFATAPLVAAAQAPAKAGAAPAAKGVPAKAPAQPADACSFEALDHDAAIAACGKLIDSKRLRGDKLALAYSARANAWYAKNDYDRALADMNAAIAARPGKADDLANRGIYKYMLMDNDGAIADYTAALHIDPAADTFANRGNALLAKSEFARALPDFEYAIQFDTQNASYYLGRGRAQRGVGKYLNAVRDFESAAKYQPGDLTAICERGIAYFYDADFSDAATDLDKCPKDISYGYAYVRIWRYIAQARSQGDGSDIRVQLDAKGIIGREWPGPVRSMILGRMKPEALIAAATTAPDAKKAKGQDCEARFYIGQYHLIRGEKGPAKQRFTEAKAACPADFLELEGANAELKRIDKK
ncbi:MAG TPA: hypothetical protein VH105_22020 [Burkholderiales bacterium]|jgi:tetratricopeptide (TPR) repeat protein|nr:hypothetical protein [Burkholderiales bacterium]